MCFKSGHLFSIWTTSVFNLGHYSKYTNADIFAAQYYLKLISSFSNDILRTNLFKIDGIFRYFHNCKFTISGVFLTNT